MERLGIIDILIGVINENQDKGTKKIDMKIKSKIENKKKPTSDHSAMIDHYCKLILIEMSHQQLR